MYRIELYKEERDANYNTTSTYLAGGEADNLRDAVVIATSLIDDFTGTSIPRLTSANEQTRDYDIHMLGHINIDGGNGLLIIATSQTTGDEYRALITTPFYIPFHVFFDDRFYQLERYFSPDSPSLIEFLVNTEGTDVSRYSFSELMLKTPPRLFLALIAAMAREQGHMTRLLENEAGYRLRIGDTLYEFVHPFKEVDVRDLIDDVRRFIGTEDETPEMELVARELLATPEYRDTRPLVAIPATVSSRPASPRFQQTIQLDEHDML